VLAAESVQKSLKVREPVLMGESVLKSLVDREPELMGEYETVSLKDRVARALEGVCVPLSLKDRVARGLEGEGEPLSLKDREARAVTDAEPQLDSARVGAPEDETLGVGRGDAVEKCEGETDCAGELEDDAEAHSEALNEGAPEADAERHTLSVPLCEAHSEALGEPLGELAGEPLREAEAHAEAVRAEAVMEPDAHGVAVRAEAVPLSEAKAEALREAEAHAEAVRAEAVPLWEAVGVCLLVWGSVIVEDEDTVAVPEALEETLLEAEVVAELEAAALGVRVDVEDVDWVGDAVWEGDRVNVGEAVEQGLTAALERVASCVGAIEGEDDVEEDVEAVADSEEGPVMYRRVADLMSSPYSHPSTHGVPPLRCSQARPRGDAHRACGP
jgi:hypothetical protein